jgi:hypothetical protein
VQMLPGARNEALNGPGERSTQLLPSAFSVEARVRPATSRCFIHNVSCSVQKDVLLGYRTAAEEALSGAEGKRVTETVTSTQTRRLRLIEKALKDMK